METLERKDYNSLSIFLVVFEGKDVVCLSREDFKDENGGAWDTDWDIFE